jgi:hypothetical protein
MLITVIVLVLLAFAINWCLPEVDTYSGVLMVKKEPEPVEEDLINKIALQKALLQPQEKK